MPLKSWRTEQLADYHRHLPENLLVVQGKLKGPKGRLALLKEENARFCAPKTRIPTPAPKKKSSLVIPNRDTFVTKIPSPKGPCPAPEGSELLQDDRQDVEADVSARHPEQDVSSPQVQAPVSGGSSTEAVTPEAQLQGHNGMEDIAAEVLQLSQEIADQLAAFPVDYPIMDSSESPNSRQPADMAAPQQSTESSSPQVAGMGTPQDFTSTFNLGELDCSILLPAEWPEAGTFGEWVPPRLYLLLRFLRARERHSHPHFCS